MKFSYSLLKKLAPSAPNINELAEEVATHLFEVESVAGDTLDIKILPNRYSDAASHWGMAREIAALSGKNFKMPELKGAKAQIKKKIEIVNEVPKLCQRIAGQYFENIKIGPSPRWMQDVLVSCGIRPINNLVDITNYVALETGEPTHAFDLEKMNAEKLFVRTAKKGETVETLDGKKFKLDENIIVLSDGKRALDIAGIKGGKTAEISAGTEKILLTAGNFDGASIYKTSRKLKLATDASQRFSHNLSPELVERGMLRAAELIEEICLGKAGQLTDVYPRKSGKRVIEFDIKKFNEFTGLDLKKDQATGYLKKLGFSIRGDLAEPPAERTDIEYFEDLAEEIVRLHGYEKLPATPPYTVVGAGNEDELIEFEDKLRALFMGFGLNEVYNYSFVSRDDLAKTGGEKWWGGVEIENPVSADFDYLRPSLAINLLKNAEENLKFSDRAAIFEIGNIFTGRSGKVEENLMIGAMISSKKENPILEIKGIVDELMKNLGIIEYSMVGLYFNLKLLDDKKSLKIISDEKLLGYLGVPKSMPNAAILEIYGDKLLGLVNEEREYEPLSKYPSIMRDISLLVPEDVKVDDLLDIIQDAGMKFVYDVDLVDFYEDEKLGEHKKSLTFRIVFQSEEKTLTDGEVNDEMKKIIGALKNKFDIEIR